VNIREGITHKTRLHRLHDMCKHTTKSLETDTWLKVGAYSIPALWLFYNHLLRKQNSV